MLTTVHVSLSRRDTIARRSQSTCNACKARSIGWPDVHDDT